MRSGVLFAAVAVSLVFAAVPAWAQDREEAEPVGTPYEAGPHFIGTFLTAAVSLDFEKPVGEFAQIQTWGIGASWGYGRWWFRPRVRISLGMFGSSFYPALGIELPLVEVLTDAFTQFFGLYISADIGYAVGTDDPWKYRATSFIRIPFGTVEGMGIGASLLSGERWCVFAGRVAGGYFPR